MLISTIEEDLVTESPLVHNVDWKYVFGEKQASGQRLWSKGDFEVTDIHTNSGYSLVARFDESRIMCGGGNCYDVFIYDFHTRLPLASLSGHTAYVRCVQADHTQLLSSSSDHQVIQWDLSTLLPVHRFTEAKDEVNWFVREGDTMFTASDDGHIRVYDLRANQVVKKLKHKNGVYCIQSDGQHTLMSGSTDCYLKEWDMRVYKDVHSIAHPSSVRTLAFDQNEVITGCFDDRIRVFDRKNMKKAVYKKQAAGTIHTLHMNEDTLMYGSGEDVVVMDRKKRATSRKLHSHNGEIYYLEFARGCLITASFDTTVKLWDFSPPEK